MIDINDFARSVLEGESLSDKLLDIENVSFDSDIPYSLPRSPGRTSKIKFSSQKQKFPSYKNLSDDNIKAKSLHFFANHELLAIEMMAAALLLFEHKTESQRRLKLGILSSLRDEQKHFKLYTNRLKDFGVEFGDYSINDYFWRQMKTLDTPAKYFAVMSLTFEAANLDFAHFYKHLFSEIGDEKSSNIMSIVYEDEISHVALGVNYFKRNYGNKNLWESYLNELPFPITPARSKGKKLVDISRVKAGMERDFIEKLKNYDDGFSITKRAEWKDDL